VEECVDQQTNCQPTVVAASPVYRSDLLGFGVPGMHRYLNMKFKRSSWIQLITGPTCCLHLIHSHRDLVTRPAVAPGIIMASSSIDEMSDYYSDYQNGNGVSLGQTTTASQQTNWAAQEDGASSPDRRPSSSRGEGQFELKDVRSHSDDVPLLVTTVDIAPGVSVQLQVYPGDDPLVVATRFCADHGLPENVIGPLKDHINDNIQEELVVEEVEEKEEEEIEEEKEEDIVPPKQSSDEQIERRSSLLDRAQETVAEVAAALESLSETKNRMLRPSSAVSSLGAEYYGRAELPVALQRSAEAEAALASDRLYADHFRKEMMLDEQRRIQELENQLKMQQAHCTETSRMLAAHRTADGYSSYGERLYKEGVEDARRKEEERQYLKSQQEEAEMAEATFKPTISKLAQSMKARSQAVPGAEEAWTRLYHTNAGITAKKKAREDAIRREKEEQEMEECSFRPQLSRMSEKMMQQKRGVSQASLAAYDRLHYQGAQQKANFEVKKKDLSLPPDATFKPEINKLSIKKAERFNRSGPADVADRLLIRGQVYNEKLEQARSEMEDVFSHTDPTTGQRLYHPKVLGRAPKHSRENVDPSNVGDHLYKEAMESAKRVQEYARETQERIEKEASKAYVNATSKKMMDRLKLDRIKAVYAYLGRTPPDCFPPEAIDIIAVVSNDAFMDTIDPEVRADVEHAARLAMRQHAIRAEQDASSRAGSEDDNNLPDLAELSASSLAIDDHPSVFVTEKQFVDLMNEVIRRTRGYTRTYLLPMPGSRVKWEEPTFQPSLDRKSIKMAEKLRPKTLPNHEILYNTAADTAAKIELMKKELEALEMEHCTFKPSMEETAEMRPHRGRVLSQQKNTIVPRKTVRESLFHVYNNPGEAPISAEVSPDATRCMEAPQFKTDTVSVPTINEPMPEHIQASRDIYDGIDAIESEIKDAIAQLSVKTQQKSTPRKDAIDLRALNTSLDYDALFGSPIEKKFEPLTKAHHHLVQQ